jgi:hypothetical protein
MRNTDPPKNRGWIQVLAKGKLCDKGHSYLDHHAKNNMSKRTYNTSIAIRYIICSWNRDITTKKWEVDNGKTLKLHSCQSIMIWFNPDA